jgi:hypothetical protein
MLARSVSSGLAPLLSGRVVDNRLGRSMAATSQAVMPRARQGPPFRTGWGVAILILTGGAPLFERLNQSLSSLWWEINYRQATYSASVRCTRLA